MTDLVDLCLKTLLGYGLSAVTKRLNERDEKDIFAYILIKWAELVMKNNILAFDEKTIK